MISADPSLLVSLIHPSSPGASDCWIEIYLSIFELPMIGLWFGVLVQSYTVIIMCLFQWDCFCYSVLIFLSKEEEKNTLLQNIERFKS